MLKNTTTIANVFELKHERMHQHFYLLLNYSELDRPDRCLLLYTFYHHFLEVPRGLVRHCEYAKTL